jgi:hypothetical protein
MKYELKIENKEELFQFEILFQILSNFKLI